VEMIAGALFKEMEYLALPWNFCPDTILIRCRFHSDIGILACGVVSKMKRTDKLTQRLDG